MVKVKEDMTGWVMNEHGFPDSRLTVIKQVEDYVNPSGKHYARWLCECSCKDHNLIIINGTHLRSGATLSCGCLGQERRQNANTKHDKTGTKLYRIWINMKSRCYNPNNEFYYCYGRKGIELCDEWKDDFESFYNWSILNGYDENLSSLECSIDRIDVDGNYCPQNCRWVDSFCQAMNHGIQKNNRSGVRGVKWQSEAGKWYAQIDIKNKRIHLGSFNNKNDAIIARLKAELKYLGDSAPQKYLFEQYKINVEDGDN